MEYPENEKWQECWELFWEEKFKKKQGFVMALTKNLGKEPKKDRGSVQSSVTYFKQGKEIARIKYFLEDSQRREAFLTTLGISMNELEEWVLEIKRNSQELPLSQASSFMYPHFPIYLKDLEESWIDPCFLASPGDRRSSYDLNFIGTGMERIRDQIESGGQILVIQAKIGKTRLLEYLRYQSQKKEKSKATTSYLYFQKNMAQESLNQETGNKKTIWMLDSDRKDLRAQMIEEFQKIQKPQRDFSSPKHSLIIMVDEKENLANILNDLKLERSNDQRYRKAEKISCITYQMKILLKDESAIQVLKTIEKYTANPDHHTILQKIQYFIKKPEKTTMSPFDKKQPIESIPEWCKELDSFTNIVKILLDSNIEWDLSECTWDSLLNKLLCFKMEKLLPQTLPYKKERVENILAEFAIAWLEESLEKKEIQRYPGSFLILPEQQFMQDLWNFVIARKKETLSLPTVQDIWKQLDNPETDIDKIKDSLWAWKFIDRQKLWETLHDFPLWKYPCYDDLDEESQANMSPWYFSRNTDRQKKHVLTQWFCEVLEKADANLLKPLFPEILLHGEDEIIDAYSIGERIFAIVPELVQQKNFQKTLEQLPLSQRHLWVLTAASATDLVSLQNVKTSWEYILKFWDKHLRRRTQEEEQTQNQKRNRIKQEEWRWYTQSLRHNFIQRHFARLRRISQKYCETLPYIPLKIPITDPEYYDENGPRADWFAWTNSIFLSEETLSCSDRLEWEPLEWLVKKGNLDALNIISGQEKGYWILERYYKECRAYLGKGTEGWKSSELPGILASFYIKDPEIFNWYKKLSLEQRREFLGHFLYDTLRCSSLPMMEEILKFIKQENPDLLTSESLESIMHWYNPQKASLASNIVPFIYLCDGKQRIKHTIAFLDILSSHIESKAYHNILEKTFWEVYRETDWIATQIPFRLEEESSEKDLQQDPNALELLAQMLEHYVEKFLSKSTHTLDNFLSYLEGYSKILLEFWKQASEKRYGNCLSSFEAWYSRRWKSSNDLHYYNAEDDTIIEQAQDTIQKTIVEWGIEILYKEASPKWKFVKQIEMILYLSDYIAKYPKNAEPEIYRIAYSSIEFNKLSYQERKECYICMMELLAKELEENKKDLLFDSLLDVAISQKIPIYSELIAILDKDSHLYDRWSAYLIEEKFLYAKSYFNPFPRSALFFLLAKDNDVLDRCLAQELQGRSEIFSSPQAAILGKILQHVVKYDVANDSWAIWFFSRIECAHKELWPALIESFGFHRKELDIFLSILNRFFLSLDTDIQIERMETIYKAYEHKSFFYEHFMPWILCILQKDNKKPAFFSMLERWEEEMETSFSSPFIYHRDVYKDIEAIKSLLSCPPQFLDWDKDCIFLLALFAYACSQALQSLEENYLSQYILWCEKQIQKMLQSPVSIWQKRINRILWQFLLDALPGSRVELHQKALDFMLGNFLALDLPEDEVYWLMNSLEISVKKILGNGAKDIGEILEKEAENMVSCYLKNQSPYLRFALFDVLLLQIYRHNPHSNVFLSILKKTQHQAIPFFIHVMRQELDPNTAFNLFLAETQASQQTLEFYLRNYMTTNDLAAMVHHFWYAQAIVQEDIVWEDWPSDIKPKRDFVCPNIPRKLLKACANLGKKKMVDIMQTRLQKYPEEKKLWQVLLNNLYKHQP